jgi:hypothetical protein
MTEYEERALHYLSRLEMQLNQVELLMKVLIGVTAAAAAIVAATNIYAALF